MPSARGTCGRFRARAPTNGPSRCLIVPSGLATRSPGARDSNAQIVPTSSDTRGVIGKTVNYFCPVMKGAIFPHQNIDEARLTVRYAERLFHITGAFPLARPSPAVPCRCLALLVWWGYGN